MEITRPDIPKNKGVSVFGVAAGILSLLLIVNVLPMWCWWIVLALFTVPIAYSAYWSFRQGCKGYGWLRVLSWIGCAVLIVIIQKLESQLQTASPAPASATGHDYSAIDDPVSWIMWIFIALVVIESGVYIYAYTNKAKVPALYNFCKSWFRVILISELFLCVVVLALV